MYNGKPSILEVINSAQMGGGMGHLYGLFRNIDREGYHFSLAADQGDYLVDEIRELDIPIHAIPLMRNRADFRGAFHIARVAMAEGADVIHCHGTRAGFFGALAKRLCKAKKSVYTVHGFSFHKDIHPAGQRFYQAIERMLGSAHDRLISVSDYDRHEAIRRGVCPPDRICTVPNAIDFDLFNPAKVNGEFRSLLGLHKDVRLVGTAARLVPQKGIEYFIESASILHRTHPDVRFVVVGEGMLTSTLRETARQRGLADVMLFAGPSDQMPEVFAGLDVFVLSSLWEGHPLTLIEALAMERPTVATSTSGAPEILEDGKCGLLVPPKDPRGLAHAIARLLDEPEFARSLAQSGRRSVLSRYSVVKMAMQTETVYRDLLDGNQPE